MAETHAGKVFKNETVVLRDGDSFIDCVFDGATIEYDGGGVDFDGCDFHDSTWTFTGSAGQTVQFIAALLRIPGNRRFSDDLFRILLGDAALAKKITKKLHPR